MDEPKKEQPITPASNDENNNAAEFESEIGEDQVADMDPKSSITWTAPEFIAHEKSLSWFIKLSAVTLLISVILYILTRDIVTIIVLIVAAISLGVYGVRQPKNRTYTLDMRGITVGSRKFVYDEFRCFTADTEGNYISITLVPHKRFSPPVGLFFTVNEQEKAMGLLSDRLPFEQRNPDLIDRLMQHIRF
jgi:hypothetical protein